VRHISIAALHAALDFNGALDGVHNARKFDQQAVAGCLKYAPVKSFDTWIDMLLPVGVEETKRSCLIRAHKFGEPYDVGSENSRESSVDTFIGHQL